MSGVNMKLLKGSQPPFLGPFWYVKSCFFSVGFGVIWVLSVFVAVLLLLNQC